MSENWIGKAVSIKCVDDFGIFQGTIKDANASKIVICRAFRNGLPLKTPDAEVTILAKDIVKISLIPSHNAANVNNGSLNNATQIDEQIFNKINITNKETKPVNKSPPANQKANFKAKSPVSIKNAFGNFIPKSIEVKMAHSSAQTINSGNINNANISSSSSINNNNGNNHNNSNNNGNKLASGVVILQRNASQPIDIAASSNNGTFNKPSAPTVAQQLAFNKMDKKKANRNRFDKNITFSTPVDDIVLDEEFDFEKNLALFDKQAIWDKIDANQKPDLVRHVNKKVKNYRHDENILTSKPTGYRQITLKDRCTAQEYVTDDGIIIPTISAEIRSRIQLKAEVFGLDWERQCDMLSRSTVELCLQVLGGARRLSLKNQHQWPKIAIICDEMCNERYSELGFATGRQLASQGLQVHILVKPNLSSALKSNREAELFKATGNAITMSVDEMPSCDLIILSLPKPIVDKNVLKWITESRSPIMAIDPPASGIPMLTVKCSILPILPLENISLTCGKLYLSNLAIPEKFYRDAGIIYKSPFAHKFVIPLHLVNENEAKSDNEVSPS
ncbi:enhancer of mRNA-decapping protein 3 [Contarinia nasturtii]|uniref:enhancer of mRNA-decapping protein 3 n=1 Tax=Contarinia nasturtii TaxID=265458 RepID=UPI0012D379A8|nr:enhancer of mRNA-decapping protein 3 [Contarinia nasturtii]